MQDKTHSGILLGYSGHGLVVAEAALKSGIDIIGYLDSKQTSRNIFNLNYLGDENKSSFEWGLASNYILGVGSNKIRKILAEKVISNGGKLLTVIHPSAIISDDVVLNRGTFVARGVCVSPGVQIGNNVILNTSSVVDHDCILGDNVHIAPGAVLCGNVNISSGVFIGANSVIKQGVNIGRNALVGAGSVVVKDIPDSVTAFGSPARVRKLEV